MSQSAAGRRLAVFYNGAFWPVRNGSHARAAAMIDRLSTEFGELVVYSYADHPEYPWNDTARRAFHQRWPGVRLVTERRTPSLRLWTRVKNGLVTLWPAVSGRLLRWRLPGATPGLREVEREARAWVVNYADGLLQLNGVDPRLCVVETHDVKFVNWSKQKGVSPGSLAALRKLRGEIGVLDAALAVLAISRVEAAFFRMVLARPRILFIPMWTAPAPVVAREPEEPAFDLVFAGSENVLNVRGLVRFMAQEHAWASRLRIAVCGRVCESGDVVALARQYPNLQLLGFVDDIDRIYARTRAAISPVDGTGTKIKVIDALAAGLPVFASPQTLDGLPEGSEGAVFPLERASVEGLLADPARLAAARLAAGRYVAGIPAGGDLGLLQRCLSNRLADAPSTAFAAGEVPCVR